jgi:hypothetical protein
MYAFDDFQYYHYGSIVSYSAAVLFCNNLQYILVIYKSGLPKSFRLFMFGRFLVDFIPEGSQSDLFLMFPWLQSSNYCIFHA